MTDVQTEKPKRRGRPPKNALLTDEKPKKRVLGRKKAPPAKTPCPQRTSKKWNGKPHRLTVLWQDPEWRAWKLEMMKGVKRGRPHGVPDGYRKNTIAPIRARIIEENQLIIRHMMATKQFTPDNDVSEQAFGTLLEAIRVPGSLKDRISAAKALLEFTQRKPAAYSEVTLNKAETFLEAVLEEAKSAEGTSGGS